MRIGNLEVNTPIALGPMAGVTDLAFRTVCAELGANLTVTEMVSSRALVYKDKKSAGLLKKTRAVSAARKSLAMTLPLWQRQRCWRWRSPDAIFWTSTWAVLCPRSPIPAMDAA